MCLNHREYLDKFIDNHSKKPHLYIPQSESQLQAGETSYPPAHILLQSGCQSRKKEQKYVNSWYLSTSNSCSGLQADMLHNSTLHFCFSVFIKRKQILQQSITLLTGLEQYIRQILAFYSTSVIVYCNNRQVLPQSKSYYLISFYYIYLIHYIIPKGS